MPLNNQTIPGMDGVLSAHREGLHRKSVPLGPLWPPCKLRAGVVGLADGRQVRIAERKGQGGKGGDSRAVSIPSIMVFTCASSLGYNTESSSKGKPRVYSGNRTFSDNYPPCPLPPRYLNDHSSDNNIRANDVETER